jgi:UDP-N-acetylglucosamine--N-acetylmuramyl-(pentapeptide) pyrophosphoryl-undecaprenol N-acetylglucosamine transferase
VSAPRLSWVVAGGGTGGHVTPALALAERIRDRGDAVTVLGARLGLESRLVPAAGFDLVTLPARQIMGRNPLARLVAVLAIGLACLEAWRVLGRLRAEIVVSVGGYASVPAVVAAFVRRVPVALVEPNAIPGRANRAAARFARRLFVQFEAAGRTLAGEGDERVRALGIPLRQALVSAFSRQGERRRPEPPIRLLVFGGSQGAHQINEAMIGLAGSLDHDAITVFHQTGESDRERVERAYRDAGLRAEVVAFEPDMPSRYTWADLALCRSGALTVAELAMAGLPSLLVPYPFAADDHQRANARALEEAGAARLLPSNPLPPDAVCKALEDLIGDPDTLVEMGARARSQAHPDAAERIIEACLELVPRATEEA